jgi:hypothetical protein
MIYNELNNDIGLWCCRTLTKKGLEQTLVERHIYTRLYLTEAGHLDSVKAVL